MNDIVREVKRVTDTLQRLAEELDNFQDIARYIKPPPGEVPRLAGVEISGESIPLNGVIGGDHLIYVDFKRRYDLEARIRKAQKAGAKAVAERLSGCWGKAGIVLSDVSGHQVTDALLSAMLHQALLLGVIYELDTHGDVTNRLFEVLNTRFYNSSSVTKFITLI